MDSVLGAGEHSRLLELEDSVLDADEPEVHLPLFEDLEVVVVWDQNKEPGEIKKLRDLIDDTQELLQPSDRVTLTGGLKGYEQGETMVTFVVSQNSFFGSVMFPWLKENGDVVMRIVQPDLPMEDIIGPVGANSDEDLDEAQDGAGFATSGVPVIPPVEHDAAKPLEPEPAGSGQHRKLQAITEVDILILYTPAASTAMGGDSASVDKITSMIATTNEIYVNSEVDVRLRLVRVEKVNYFEKPTRPTTLGDLLNGVVPNSARLRSEYGADLIQMVTIDSTYCGIGYAPAVGSLNSRNGLSVVSTKCMTSTSAHEIGHNFGCYHDYYSSNRNDKYNGLSRCELSGSQKFSTVLSYGCQNGAKPQELFFLSNPKVFVNRGGTMFSTGDTQTADCASAHMAGRSTVAAYFPTMGGGGGGGGEGGNGNGQTQTCAGGGSCTSPNKSLFAAPRPSPSGVEKPPASLPTIFARYLSSVHLERRPVLHPLCVLPSAVRRHAAQPVHPSGVEVATASLPESEQVQVRDQGTRKTCLRAGSICKNPGATDICPSGSFCSDGYVCATFGDDETCCSADYPAWCGGDSCYQRGHVCGLNNICPSGAKCQTSLVCSVYEGDEGCCPPSSPVLCGDELCHAAGYRCPTYKVQCPSGGSCLTPNVCASFGGDDTCCSPNFPVWLDGYQCPGVKKICPGGGSCTTPKVCSSFEDSSVCCSPNYPTWCGGDICYGQTYKCPNAKVKCPGGAFCTGPKGSSCNRRLLSELGENEAAPALPASGSQEFSFDLGFGDFGSVDSDSGSDSDIDGSEDSIPATPVNTDEVEVAMDAFAQATDVEIYLLMDALVEIAMKSEAVQVDEGEEEEEEELPMGSTSLAQGLLTWPTDSDPAERSESSSVSDEADSLGSIPAKADSLGSVPAEAPTGRVSISADQFIADSSPALDPTPPVMEDRAADATTSPVKVLV
eukprot:gene24151-9740_t